MIFQDRTTFKKVAAFLYVFYVKEKWESACIEEKMSVCGRTTELIMQWERLPTKIEEANWTSWCFSSSWSKEIVRMLNSITSSLRLKSRWMKSQLKLNHSPSDGLKSLDYLKTIYSSIWLRKLIVIALALQVIGMTKGHLCFCVFQKNS